MQSLGHIISSRLFRAETAALLLGLLTIACWTNAAQSQGSGSSRTSPPRKARRKTPEEFHRDFWKYLHHKQTPYQKWASFPRRDGFRAGEDPHGKFTKTYINSIAAKQPDKLARGAILVMENYDEDQKTLTHVTIMYRVKGYDPKHFDWYWLDYLPDGKLAKTEATAKEPARPIAGKVNSCIECHTRAAKDDLAFSNDPEEMSTSDDDAQEPTGEP